MDIAIVDDMKDEIESAKTILKDYSALNNIKLNIVTFSSAEAFLKKFRPFLYTVLYIVATNTFSGKVKLQNERYLSTHRNGNGIGLASIETIAESCGGTAKYYHEKNMFYTNVILPIGKRA